MKQASDAHIALRTDANTIFCDARMRQTLGLHADCVGINPASQPGLPPDLLNSIHQAAASNKKRHAEIALRGSRTVLNVNASNDPASRTQFAITLRRAID